MLSLQAGCKELITMSVFLLWHPNFNRRGDLPLASIIKGSARWVGSTPAASRVPRLPLRVTQLLYSRTFTVTAFPAG